ncbi:hypothetical protein F5X98DRAFT_332774, partial [Xylaria grammica]
MITSIITIIIIILFFFFSLPPFPLICRATRIASDHQDGPWRRLGVDGEVFGRRMTSGGLSIIDREFGEIGLGTRL